MGRLIDAEELKEIIGCENAVKYGNADREQQAVSYGTMMMYEINDAIDVAPTVGGWISVKDRLPVRPPDVCGLLVRRQWYLVALESGTVLTLAYEFDEDRWQGVGSPVTHWMPLPKPPERNSQ